MATTTLEIPGVFHWAKLTEADRDQADWHKDHDGATTISVVVDGTTSQEITDAGVRLLGKPEEDGSGFRYTFKRKWDQGPNMAWANGEPAVFSPDGSRWDWEKDGLIGNGSKGIVFVDVYSTKIGIGTRLKAVQVIDHLKFDKNGGGSETPLNIKNYTTEADVDSDLEDIPF